MAKVEQRTASYGFVTDWQTRIPFRHADLQYICHTPVLRRGYAAAFFSNKGYVFQ